MKYTRLSITTTTEFSDIVANTLWDCGSMGVAIYDKNDILSLAKQKRYFDYIDESLLKADPRVVVSGFFSCDFDYAAIKQKIENLKNHADFDTGSLEIITKDEDSEDWQNAWKVFYKPLEIGKITIVPQWLKPKDNKTIPVFIDPKNAFGTGNHESTSMCIELLQGLDNAKKTVLDMGCGSGILGICALMLGASHACFVDIESNAINTTCENGAFNGVLERANLTLGGFDTKFDTKFDIILANLTADLLIEFLPYLLNNLNNGGKVVVSGILNEYAEKVKKVFSARKLPSLQARLFCTKNIAVNDVSYGVKNAFSQKLVLQKQITQNDWTAMLWECK